jgi:excisionase family DNA binding protein
VNVKPAPDARDLLTPAEVAVMFRVDPKTVTKWAKTGKLTSIRTPGNHRRYYRDEVMALLHGQEPDRPDRGIPLAVFPWPPGTAVRFRGETVRVADRDGLLFLARIGGSGLYPVLSDLDGITLVSRR